MYLKENHSVIIFGFAVISLILSNDLNYFDNFKMWPKIDYLITILRYIRRIQKNKTFSRFIMVQVQLLGIITECDHENTKPEIE